MYCVGMCVGSMCMKERGLITQLSNNLKGYWLLGLKTWFDGGKQTDGTDQDEDPSGWGRFLVGL